MYLKPTQSLWTKVQQKIDSMFKERLIYANDWFHYGMNKHEFEKACITSVIPSEEDELVQKLGAKWFSVADDFQVRIPNGNGYDSYTLSAKAGGRLPLLSPNWHGYHDANRPIVRDERIADIARRRREAVAKIQTEKEEFIKSVEKVWNDAPSVNALAKIWPPIIDLLPFEVVQSMEKKSPRRTAKQMAEGVDTKSLSVHILKAKVGQ